MDLTGIDPNRIPRHVAAVMDGNGRWATRRGLKRTEGHAAGEEALFDAVDGAIELGLDWFTVYAFSTENWKRPPDEVRYLMGFNKGILERHAEDLNERNVRIRFIGRRDWRVPRGVLRRMEWATDLTRTNTGLTFTIAFNYGGRAELVDAVRQLVADGVKPEKIDEKAIRARLYFFTLGLLGIGWLIDLFLIPGMARSARQKYADGPVDYDISWLLLTFLGAFGIHRFYRGAWLTGLLYLCTGGLLFAGVVWDFWFLNEQCSARNMELARPAPRVERPVTF